MNVLIIGSKGQLGFELLRTRPESFEVTGCDVAEVDIRDPLSVVRLVSTLQPALILNVAAYTAVDRAESERDLAFEVNARGAGNLAEAAASIGARMIHLSTDFVFSGDSGRPYRPEDPPAPISVYGLSKAEGERRVLEPLGERATILRTSWLYSIHGRNFVKTMLAKMDAGDPLRVVTDQAGAPTWGYGLARAIWELAAIPSLPNVLHWSDAGVASWYDFAVAIHEEALARGMVRAPVDIRPVPGSEYPTAAQRPPYSALDSSRTWTLLGRVAPHWRVSLRAMLAELESEGGLRKEE